MEYTGLKKKMFGSEINIIVYGTPKEIAEEVIEEVYTEGLRLQKIFNLYDNQSILSLLNTRRKLEVPNEFLEVLTPALKMCEETKGEYDISLGKQFMQRKKRLEITKVQCSYKDIKIENKTVTLSHPDVIIDLGSIAKGYITDKMAEFMKSKGVLSGLIDSRGDIVIFGEEQTLEIQHPREKDKSISEINVKDCGVATSGDYSQYDKDFDKSHIINSKEYISVTVIAQTLMEADLYATAIFVSSKERIEKILNKNKKIKVLSVDKDLKTEEYNNFKEVVAK